MSTEQLKLSNQICFPLYSASRLITQAYQPYLDKMGITYPQYLVLMVLWENDEISVNDVAKKLILKTNTISPLLQRMAKQELIERNRSSDDERCVKVKLTDKGKALEAKAKLIPEQMLDHLLSDSVELDDVIQMRHQLNQWIEILKDKQK
ncbi:MarR family winged helix-turn-helix transcriptional regulator [Acidiluteibacter ferrifornacis]|jgi:MarR family transcriptional regulator, organic hydroperoxide resistance regulator|uniref:HTH-type transcriptional regulator SarZ n=1 Tax=Acidiluteibacter ferrifornacis TaxID=2692424 RepID=A0A6N9NNF2_9FLAO|nr:MarR family transcriptional regulator [Acidiluteibacter ferrifornacis]NBG67382.1 MarR family transcriptional regulator [Acidiluteibacter ferrifornacis]